MAIDPLELWHKLAAQRDIGALDALLADEAVFFSPVVHTPQRGKAITKKYLAAALSATAEGDQPHSSEDGRAACRERAGLITAWR